MNEELPDVSSHPNATGSVADGIFNGRNAGPTINDPVVSFTMPGQIDGSRFHRLSVKVAYDGPFSLEDSAGGGHGGALGVGGRGCAGPASGEDHRGQPRRADHHDGPQR